MKGIQSEVFRPRTLDTYIMKLLIIVLPHGNLALNLLDHINNN